MSAREVAKWYPDSKQIEQFAHSPTLKILPKEVCVRDHNTIGLQVQHDTEIEWLPPPGRQILTSNIQCKILFQKNGVSYDLFSINRNAALVCSSGPNGDRHISFDLDQPFLITEDELSGGYRYCLIDRRPSGASHVAQPPVVWNRSMLDDCVLRVDFSCSQVGAQCDLNRLLLGDDAKGDSSSVFTGVFRRLDDLSEGDGRANLVYQSRAEMVENFGFELRAEMCWTYPEPEISVLQSINGQKAAIRQSLSISTPPPPPPEEFASKKFEIRYVFSGDGPKAKTRTIVVKNLSCPLCKSRLPQSSFDRLHFHYLTSHDHFKIEVHESWEEDDVVHKVLHVELHERPRQRASNDVPDEREMAWIRPNRPFDLQKYLTGEDLWGVERTVAKKARQKSPTRENSALQSLPPWGPKSPSAVEQIQPRKRKRYEVPKIQGVNLYRTSNKRKLEAGELLSESDEDSDGETWAARKQRLRSPPVMGCTRGAFFDLLDEFVHGEKTSSDVHLPDVMIRFCRKYRHELNGPLMYQDLQLKLDQLVLTGRIDRRVMEYCNGLLRATRAATSPDDGEVVVTGTPKPVYVRGEHPLTDHPKVRYSVNGMAVDPEIRAHITSFVLDRPLSERVTTRQALSKKGYEMVTKRVLEMTREKLEQVKEDYLQWAADLQAENSGHIAEKRGRTAVVTAGTCVCGLAAAQDRGTIMCANPRCRKAAFHLGCVNLEKRDRKWRCKDCSGRATEWLPIAVERPKEAMVEQQQRQRQQSSRIAAVV